MKLGISYNIFDGEEILPFALKNLRPFANFMVMIILNYYLNLKN